jgi:hypothetical protein
LKEVIVRKGERWRRFVLVYNPGQAKKDKATRQRTLKKIEETLSALGDQRWKARKKAFCALLSHQTQGRYVKQNKKGELRLIGLR